MNESNVQLPCAPLSPFPHPLRSQKKNLHLLNVLTDINSWACRFYVTCLLYFDSLPCLIYSHWSNQKAPTCPTQGFVWQWKEWISITKTKEAKNSVSSQISTAHAFRRLTPLRPFIDSSQQLPTSTYVLGPSGQIQSCDVYGHYLVIFFPISSGCGYWWLCSSVVVCGQRVWVVTFFLRNCGVGPFLGPSPFCHGLFALSSECNAFRLWFIDFDYSDFAFPCCFTASV